MTMLLRCNNRASHRIVHVEVTYDNPLRFRDFQELFQDVLAGIPDCHPLICVDLQLTLTLIKHISIHSQAWFGGVSVQASARITYPTENPAFLLQVCSTSRMS